MKLLIYLDESGNTGDAIFKRSVEDSFAGQASFALAVLGVPDDNLEEVVQKLKTKHNVLTPELKASSVFEKNLSLFRN